MGTNYEDLTRGKKKPSKHLKCLIERVFQIVLKNILFKGGPCGSGVWVGEGPHKKDEHKPTNTHSQMGCHSIDIQH